MAPTKLPAKTSPQLPQQAGLLTRWLAHAITSRMLPVNSSAPATTTRIRPREKAIPPISRRTP